MVEKKKKIGFIILHYNAKNITELCISKILSLDNSEKFEIVVVDNDSPDKSGIIIKKEYVKYSNIHVILNDENLGFARGNNIGFNYLKKNFELDFMIIMNNDVLINDKRFISKLYNNYNLENFDVLGPDIYAPRIGVHQNPLRFSALTYEEMIKLRNYLNNRSKLFIFFFVRHKIGIFVRKLLNVNNTKNKLSLLNKNKPEFKSNLAMSKKNNFVLHGACYIFSNDFLTKRNYAFWPKTFMFFEEDILQYECEKNNLKMIFCPAINVIHLEDVSTDTILKSNYKKDRFKSRQLYNSLNCFLNKLYEK